jgi:hypothetical protein
LKPHISRYIIVNLGNSLHRLTVQLIAKSYADRLGTTSLFENERLFNDTHKKKMATAFDVNLSAQELVDMLPTGVAILDQNDESVMVNRRFRELISCSSARSFECWSQSIHPDDFDRIATAYFEASCSKHAIASSSAPTAEPLRGVF